MNQLQAGPGGAAPPLALMLRPSCMLCLEAEYVLAQVGIPDFDRVDIERMPGLESRYGERIPVLVRGDGAELDWPFDAAAVRRFSCDHGTPGGPGRATRSR